MKSIFRSSVGIAAALLLLLSKGAFAIDPPHNFACGTCHTSHATLGSSGYNNICLTCHRPGSPLAGRKPFTLADMANPFDTYTSPLPAKMYQTSHNWNGSDTLPAAGAQSPLDSLLNQSKTVGSLACTRCHNVHAVTGTTTPPLLRSINDRDQMCLDCHRSRNTVDHTRGTHPVNFQYTTAIRGRSGFNALPLNSNSGNPTSAMRLKQGRVLCSTCHGVHYTDSNSATFDNRSGYYKLTQSQGYLLRTDLRTADPSSLNICTNCHIKANHHGSTKQQNVQCGDCHGGHVDTGDGSAPNVYLVRRFINVSTQYGAVRNRTVFFRSTSARNYVDANGNGICQACHAVPPPGGTYPQEHASRDAKVCNGCHTHNNTSSSFSAAGCTTCHGYPPVAGTAGGPNGFAGNYAAVSGVSESTTPHKRHAASGTDYTFACAECHKGNSHASGTYQDVFLSPAGTLAATAGASPAYNTATRTCANVYCHSDGAPRNASLTPVLTTKPIPGWAGGAGKITACSACHDASPATNAHARHIAKGFGCAVCHAATVSGNSTVSDRTKHANGSKDVSFGAGTLAAGTTWNAGTAGCSASRCHSSNAAGSPPVTSPIWTLPATGSCGSCHPTSAAIAGTGAVTIQTAGHSGHLVKAYGPATYLGTAAAACQTCHVYSGTQPDPRHVNGTVDLVTGAGSACSGCHRGTLPAWNLPTRLTCTDCHAAVPSTLPNGVAAPYKAAFASAGHGRFAASNQCTACHDGNSAHISGALGDNVRLYGANDNTVCSGCHNGSAARTMSTHVLDRNVTPTPGLCKACHDVHGTTNIHMIRTVINGTTILFTNTSTGFVKTVAPYNGLCQVCHTATNHWRSGAAPDGHPTKNCLSCHDHTASFAFAPTGGGTCDGCHGYPPAPAGFAGTLGNWSSARLQDYAGGAGAHLLVSHIKKSARPSEGWANCTPCHGNGSLSPSTHTMALPVAPSKITIDVDDRYKFNPALPLGPAQYNGILKDGGANATGTCSNVSCHFKPSKKWSTER
jgi:predicted CxxxxCH...CXXCH cytochrome family protein